MDDLISRQAAIKAICEDGTWLESQGCTEITMVERKQRDADILGELPSAESEREKGEWGYSDDMYETGVCSCCGYDSQEPISYAITNFLYCPRCGADMRGEQDE